jgi:hypothetical protein
MKMNVEKRKVMRISRQPSPVKLMIDQKQLQNMESFKYLGRILTNDGRCTSEIKLPLPISLLATSKASELFFIVCTLPLNMLISSA